MILFEKDWEKYPSAVVDYDCTNKTFLNYALLLKHMGVSNWKWPLALINPMLRGKDPYSKDLTTDEMIAFAIEFKVNPWAFFRNCARVPGTTDEQPLFFNANRSNMGVYWFYFNHITVCLEQLRQTGKTFQIEYLDVLIGNMLSTGARTLLLTKDDPLRAKTMKEIRIIQDLLPHYLKMHSKNDIGNSEEINISALDNNYKALVAKPDPIAADKLGRGHTAENARIDEMAFIHNLKISMQSMLPATTAARERARIRGLPYGNIFATTAGKRDDKNGAFAYEYFHTAAEFSEFFFDSSDREELVSAVKGSSKSKDLTRVHCVFNHRQLGYTDKWLKEVASENNSTGEAYERDYLNRWTFGSQSSPFTVEETTRIRDSLKEPLYMTISKYGQIVTRWYIKDTDLETHMTSNSTILAVDTSDAMGNDDLSGSIRLTSTGANIGSFTLNEINLITVANFLIELLETYPRMTMIIERRNQAATIIDYMVRIMLSRRMDPFRRIYNTIVQNRDEHPDKFSDIQKSSNHFDEYFIAQNKKHFGFATSGSGVTSRSELFGATMKQAVKYTGDTVNDSTTINQLLSLIIKNGRVTHPDDGHDDMCVSWLLGFWLLTKGKNLDYYGINPSTILTLNTSVNSIENYRDMRQNEANRRTREYLNYLLGRLKTERDQTLARRIIFEIENIKNKLGPNHEISLTISGVVDTIRKEQLYRSVDKGSMF